MIEEKHIRMDIKDIWGGSVIGNYSNDRMTALIVIDHMVINNTWHDMLDGFIDTIEFHLFDSLKERMNDEFMGHI